MCGVLHSVERSTQEFVLDRLHFALDSNACIRA